jgi:rod shape-determining protein MreC
MRFRNDDERSLQFTALALVVVSLFLTAYTAKYPRVARYGSSFVTMITYPISSVSYGIGSWFEKKFEKYIFLVRVKEENESLSAQLHGIATISTQLDEIRGENERLRRLLKALRRFNPPSLSANVIALDPSSWVEGAVLNRGSNDGVEIGLPVVSSSGVVGQITSVTPFSAKVLFLTDRASGVDVMLQSSRARGVVRGLSSARCTLEFISSEEQVSVGDRVLTSGLDGIYPKGLLVGLVDKVSGVSEGLFHQIEVKVAANLAKLEEVAIILKSENAQS